MCVSQLSGQVDGGTGWRSNHGKRSAKPSRSSGYGTKQTQNGIAVKNQVCTCASLFVRRLLFLTCVMLDATLEAVEGAGLVPTDIPPGEPRTCRQHPHVRRTRLSLFGRLSFTLALLPSLSLIDSLS